MKSLTATSVAIALVLLIGMIVVTQLEAYQMRLAIDNNASRAMASSNVDERLRFMELTKTGLERYGLTEGHTVLLFPTPDNDLALLNSSADQIIERLKILQTVDRDSDAYQNGMIDTRDAIALLWSPVDGYLWLKYWVIWWVDIALWALFIVAGLVLMVQSGY